MKRVLWILALSAACGLSTRAVADETPAEAAPPAGEHVQMDGCAGCDGHHWAPQCCGQPRCPWGDLWAGYCHERRPCPSFERPRHCCEPAADYCCEPCGGSWEGCGGGWDFFGLFRNCGSCCEPECCEEACCEPECCEEHCCAEPCCDECDPCCGGCGWDLFGFFNKCFDHGCCDSCCEESCCEPTCEVEPDCCAEPECCDAAECCEPECCEECDPCGHGCGWDLFGFFHKCFNNDCCDSCCEDSCCEPSCDAEPSCECEPSCCDECDPCGHGCGWDLFGLFHKCFGGGHSDCCCQDMVVVSDEALPSPAASESPTPADPAPMPPMPEAEGAPTAELPTGRPLYLPRGTQALELAPSA